MIDAKERLTRLSPEKRALLLARLSKSKSTEKPLPSAPLINLDESQRYQPFALTDLQQAYWIGRSGIFEMGAVASHSFLEFESEGLDLDRLNKAWQQVIDRHDMLRAVILPDGLQQVLKDVPPYRIEALDLRDANSEESASRLDDIRRQLSHQALPADKWPLFEICAAKLKNGRLRIFVSLDALIVDAWSMAILLREWSQFYRNPNLQLPRLEVSFRDYVSSETARRNSDDYRRAREYWQKRAPLLPPAPELPQAKPAVTITHPRFVRRTARLEADIWARLKARAANANLTAPGILMAAYTEVLSLWSRSQHFTINVPRFNRVPLHPQTNDVVGEFASFTLLEVDNTRPGSFEERARRLQEQLWRDLNHAEFSGVEVLRELAQAQGRTAGSLMPVVFTSIAREMRDIDPDEPLDPTVPGQLIHAINQTSQVWLDNHVTEKDGVLQCDWDTVDEIFPPELPQDMLDSYFGLLRNLATDEQSWQASWAESARRLVPPQHLDRRNEINSKRAAIPEILAHQLFDQHAAQQPNHPAVIAADRTLTYGELYRVSNQVGRRLRELGATPNTLVAVVMEKGWEQTVAALGILRSGAAYLPIDADTPAERLRYLLQHSEAKIVLTQSSVDPRLEWPQGIERLRIDRETWAGIDDGPLDPKQTPDDLMYVLYTSGSTGLPKGVMIAHRGVVNCLLQTNTKFQITRDDRVLALTALHHDMSVFDIFSVLGAGGTLVVPQASGRRDPAHWSDLMLRHNVTLWNSVPAMMEMMLEYAADRPGSLPRSLRLAFLGGDWIQVNLPTRLQAVAENARVVSVGGPTETTLWNIWFPVEQIDPEWKSIPYGQPIANTKYYVFNEAMEHCPVWVPGELCCAAVGLAKGYWRDEEKTRAKFFNHPVTGERIYRTGDLGRFLPDGNIEFVGRADFQVKIQGQRIELGEIESILQQHPGLRAAVVAAVGETQGKKRLVAYVVPNEQNAGINGELRTYLLQKLPEHMVPSTFVKLRELPLTANGKVNRLALAALAEPPVEPNNSSEAKADSLAARIQKIIAKILEVPDLDRGANLMGYGANSIDMVRIGNQLEKEFGFRPRMDQLFRLQTVDALARYYEEHRKETALSPETVDAKGEPDLKALIASYRVMLDPVEREAFKKSQPGLRRGDTDKRSIELTRPELNDELRRRYRERRSHRKFSLKPVGFAEFSKFLSCLRQIIVDGKPKYLYASPGGLYPGQVYLHVKPGRVERIEAGTYYYHPVQHRLIVLTPNVDLDRNIHVPFVNTPIFDEAAFSIFQVVALRAIVPSYGERSIHFATLEAGLIAHLMESSARANGIGLCQIGTIEFDKIRHLFALEQDHVLIHSLLGGLMLEQSMNNIAPAEAQETAPDRAASILQKIKQLSKDEVRKLLEANKALNDGVQLGREE
jgi:pyochelin synthetase